ncbi:hypothetical protein AHIS1636_40270 [Arthrobacter mangrovi]|uniref:Uncharacterized protein n=1 Tax=Arthrobacter mangrovi TaxID=2966350 RepID=A0ABQ5N020_9MICC|nr:hypothetical protein AHIS1636_40270 [Arthrobacter mangrovi]
MTAAATNAANQVHGNGNVKRRDSPAMILSIQEQRVRPAYPRAPTSDQPSPEIRVSSSRLPGAEEFAMDLAAR